MPIAFRGNITAGEVALFDEPNQTGSVFDIDAARNAPLKTPASNLDKVYFHSALDYMEVLSETTKTINHAAVSGAAADPDAAVPMNFNKAQATHTLVTFSPALSYVPDVLIVIDDNVMQPGMPIQSSGNNMRYAMPEVSTSAVKISEWSIVGTSGLSAVSRTYKIIVLKRPPDASGKVLFDFDASTGIVTMGLDKFDSSRRYLQVVPGGSPFGITYGPSIDLNNGAPRSVDPDGTIQEPVPDTAKFRWRVEHRFGTYTGSYGASMNYKGSFAGSPAILVQAP
jgi:hypothetical protein